MNALKSEPTGDLPQALNEWADWIYWQALLASRAAKRPDDWRDFMSVRERRVMEACERLAIWRPQ